MFDRFFRLLTPMAGIMAMSSVLVGASIVGIFSVEGGVELRQLPVWLIGFWIYGGIWAVPAALLASVPTTAITEWMATRFLQEEGLLSWVLAFAMLGIDLGALCGLAFLLPGLGDLREAITMEGALVPIVAGALSGLTTALFAAPMWYQMHGNRPVSA
jgi:hypothetical protein